ncbi:hypothetical protein AVEN_34752-1 [Araneus ventricosus]|uniref:Uncharacterized protein n=2 Tax=Araneus ventricosus TaxID=182803 RepID=A0A4Y2WIF7_ARAVE|nr:hypothetical protein AVEN_192604-1 [Araneus ventricosus]GBO37275.1 hypothetical protein AVEN_34752-1 [Araneus ventricosus]
MNLTSDSLLNDAASILHENETVFGNESLHPPVSPVLDMLPDPVIKLAHDILICVLLISVMFAMGCHITWNEAIYVSTDKARKYHLLFPVAFEVKSCCSLFSDVSVRDRRNGPNFNNLNP